MKKIIYILAVTFFLAITSSKAQQDIVNGDFEFWDTIPGTNGLEDPIGWNSNNLGLATCTSNVFIPGISKSEDAYSGNYSLRVSPSNNGSAPISNQVEIGHFSGSFNYNYTSCFIRNCYPLPLPTYRHLKLGGYYKYQPDPFVWDTVKLDYYQGYFNSISGQVEILSFEIMRFQMATTWTYFEIPINYFYPSIQGVEFAIGISFFSANVSLTPEAYFLLDSLFIVPDLTTSTKEPHNHSVVQLYPNPAEDILTISSPETFSNYEVFDLRGRINLTGKYSPTIDLKYLDKGIYFIRLHGRERTLVEKFVKE